MDPGGPVWVSLSRLLLGGNLGSIIHTAECGRVRLSPATCGWLCGRHVLHDERLEGYATRRLCGEVIFLSFLAWHGGHLTLAKKYKIK